MADTNITDYSLKKCNLTELLNREPIRVPMIQRDYAQGRKNNTATDIRHKFVLSLIQAISDGKDLELDFIYGSNRRNAFEPLDGQQRITTLFLLHWMLGSDNLIDKAKYSKLTYETRATSADFCNELVLHSAEILRHEADKLATEKDTTIKNAEEALHKVREARPEENTPEYLKELADAEAEYNSAKSIPDVLISDIIADRAWFNYLWKYDPTIQSMLVMIDAIWEEMDWSLDLEACRKNLEKITFSCLNLGEFGLSDELFIKMNARGKQLSEFDILKSSLEEEIQVQKQSGICDSTTEAKWRSLIDGEWIDWFWNKYAGEQIGAITEPKTEYLQRLSLSKVSEDFLKRLILRTITLSILKTDNLEQTLLDISYDDSIANLDWILSTYQESKRIVKKNPALNKQVPNIEFNEIIHNLSCLYYKDAEDKYHDVFSIIPNKYNINPDPDKQQLSYLTLFLGDSCPNDCKIVYYAIMRYVRENPIELENGEFKELWKENFIDWVRFCRNLTAIDNNNIRIDTAQKTITALFGIDRLLESLDDYKKSLSVPEEWNIKGFISSINKKIVGVDNQSLAEEVAKAKLSLDPSWRAELETAEQDIYLWGQIRCLINWSENNLDKFKEYSNKLIQFINFSDKNLLYAGMLSIDGSYAFNGERFYQWTNKDRDNSIKRYLRDNDIKDNCGYYAPVIKSAIDKWISDYSSLSLQAFLQESIKLALLDGPSYRWCILSMPSILNDAVYKKLFEHNGHYVLAEKKTRSSHCYDVAFEYLYYKVKEKIDSGEKYSDLLFYDSVGITYQHALSFIMDGNRLLLKEQPNGAYSFSMNDSPDVFFPNETAMLKYLLQLCNIQ